MKDHSLPLTSWFVFALLSLFVLSACSAAASAQQAVIPSPHTSLEKLPEEAASNAPQPQPEAALPKAGWVLDVPRVDEQGAITVEITPLNLNVPGHTLDFSVALNTHSVDLSMDLAALATLITDTGLELPASAWDAPLGGHHVQGVLHFPAVRDGAGVMDGVRRLTLVIRDLDAPERTFVWEK